MCIRDSIYTILDVMSQTGNAVFNNLALLFAMGVAIGMARKEKEVAALSGAVALSLIHILKNTPRSSLPMNGALKTISVFSLRQDPCKAGLM